MEKQELVKAEFRKNLQELVRIDDFKRLYRLKSDNVRQNVEFLESDRKNMSVKEKIGLSKKIQAMQDVIRMCENKIRLLERQEIKVIKKLEELAPTGNMDDGFYSKEIQQEKNEQHTSSTTGQESTNQKIADADLALFAEAFPQQNIFDLYRESGIPFEKLIDFSKEFIEYSKSRNETTPEKQ